MIRDRNEMPMRPIELDLTGPEGNAFVLLGYAKRFLKQLNKSPEEIERIIEEMQSSDYENLVAVFEKNLGEYVTLYR